MLAALLWLCSSLRDLGLAEETPERAQIAATYRVDLAAFNLGDFHFTAKLKGRAYELRAQGRFSLISGMIYRASGRTTSTGKLSKVGAEPSRFTVTYKGGKKKEERRISFVDGAVDQVSIVPPKKQNPRSVPVTADQLENALDPLTATFLSVRSNESLNYLDICQQPCQFSTVDNASTSFSPRSDLSLWMKMRHWPFWSLCGLPREVRANRRLSARQSRHQIHDADRRHRSVACSLASTDLYVPYRIVVPTTWGSGLITLSEINLHLDG